MPVAEFERRKGSGGGKDGNGLLKYSGVRETGTVFPVGMVEEISGVIPEEAPETAPEESRDGMPQARPGRKLG